MTSCKEVVSPTEPIQLIIGGDRGNRTHGLLNANQSLSQLSYTPVNLVPPTGFEPVPEGLKVPCPTIETKAAFLVLWAGIEPAIR